MRKPVIILAVFIFFGALSPLFADGFYLDGGAALDIYRSGDLACLFTGPSAGGGCLLATEGQNGVGARTSLGLKSAFLAAVSGYPPSSLCVPIHAVFESGPVISGENAFLLRVSMGTVLYFGTNLPVQAVFSAGAGFGIRRSVSESLEIYADADWFLRLPYGIFNESTVFSAGVLWRI